MTPRDGAPLQAGLIVPRQNTVLQRELLGWLPLGSTCTTKTIPPGKDLLTHAGIPAFQEASLTLARAFPAGLDVVAYGCTAAGFIAGPAADAAMAARIREATGTPAVTTAGSMVQELLALDAASVDLVTPYSDAIIDKVCAYLDAAGIAVGRVERLPAPSDDDVSHLTAEDVRQAAFRLVGSESDAIFVTCSQIPAASVLMRIRAACGKPVLSSVQALANQAMLAVRQGARARAWAP